MSRRSTAHVPTATSAAVAKTIVTRPTPTPSLTGCSPMAQFQGDHLLAPANVSLIGRTKATT